MKNSIEAIWKEGFLNESTLVAPRINDLYNQKSMHVVDRMKRMFRINLVVMLVMSVIFPVMYYFLGVLWQGLAASLLLLATAWYTRRQMASIGTLDQGATSFDYLSSVDRWLKEVLLKNEKIVRFLYPLYFLIAISTIWSTFNRPRGVAWSLQQKYPHSILVDNLSMLALIVGAVGTLGMFYFSRKIYRFDLRLMFGGVFRKLKSTIAEMEELRGANSLTR
ncbi:hypothetical protein [Pedobacter psychroterrae]|uniref:Uncharacterized protein n=1 Tax=Pedobacter psychroterrae TaxID=2530453 RepID=A0A4R0N9I6_9SPHI|nr:hypothetical protein [Pedobacter psychroterrae]TCC96851.1 hypothetical protein EZ437_20930 [Pedobacter psychroterrae]